MPLNKIVRVVFYLCFVAFFLFSFERWHVFKCTTIWWKWRRVCAFVWLDECKHKNNMLFNVEHRVNVATRKAWHDTIHAAVTPAPNTTQNTTVAAITHNKPEFIRCHIKHIELFAKCFRHCKNKASTHTHTHTSDMKRSTEAAFEVAMAYINTLNLLFCRGAMFSVVCVSEFIPYSS